ncbi:SAF domain-containing protein [Microbacterium sp. G2-8]|uniref:SAF domain-containing protein n=1 Tax=Microbacterium sp. G2-8 TaxID=2842454 RepID=UPI001C8917AA|nr:SAF domain-containing protein [Microbacterium sp. G2-8]
MASSSRLGGHTRTPRFDARFVVGIVLVIGSIAGVWGVVNAARQTAPVLAAAGTIVPGQTVTASDVEEVDAQLGDAAGAYLAPSDLDDGLVVTRTVAAGELLPTAAVGSHDDAGVTTVVVQSALEVPASVEAGATVELWAAPLVEPGTHGEPAVVVESAVVADVLADDGVVSQAGARLELVVARDDVAHVLEHVSGGSALSAVPVVTPVSTTAEDASAESGGSDDEVDEASDGESAE